MQAVRAGGPHVCVRYGTAKDSGLGYREETITDTKRCWLPQ